MQSSQTNNRIKRVVIATAVIGTFALLGSQCESIRRGTIHALGGNTMDCSVTSSIQTVVDTVYIRSEPKYIQGVVQKDNNVESCNGRRVKTSPIDTANYCYTTKIKDSLIEGYIYSETTKQGELVSQGLEYTVNTPTVTKTTIETKVVTKEVPMPLKTQFGIGGTAATNGIGVIGVVNLPSKVQVQVGAVKSFSTPNYVSLSILKMF